MGLPPLVYPPARPPGPTRAKAGAGGKHERRAEEQVGDQCFLWRIRLRSFLYLCLRIFLRRFLTTLLTQPPFPRPALPPARDEEFPSPALGGDSLIQPEERPGHPSYLRA